MIIPFSSCIPIIFICLTVGLRYCGFTGRTKKGSIEADVLSYSFICFGFVLYLSYWGWVIWFGGYDGHINQLYDERPFVYSVIVHDCISTPMMWYQFYNLIACIYIPDYRDYPSWAHHITTMSVAYLSMIPTWYYYAVFVFGIIETSTIPLVLVDVFKLFPRYRIRFPIINMGCRVGFVLSFISIRLVWLPIVTIQFAIDCCRWLPFVNGIIFASFLYYIIVCLFMVGLQYYWGMGMLKFLKASLPSDYKY